MATADDITVFRLKPHSSLGKQGFLVLMLFVSFVSFASGAFFVYLGAWPVMGFFGIEVLLLYGAFRLNYFSARRVEELEISSDCFKLTKISAKGHASEVSLNPYWLRFELKPSRHDPEVPGDLIISSHGKSYHIGSFLSPEERACLFDAVSGVLDRHRQTASI